MKIIKFAIFFSLFLSLIGCGSASSEQKTAESGTFESSNDDYSNNSYYDNDYSENEYSSDNHSNSDNVNNGNPSNGASEMEETSKNLMRLYKEYRVKSDTVIIAQEHDTKIKLTITNSSYETTAELMRGSAEINVN
jgi:hypothetical protein